MITVSALIQLWTIRRDVKDRKTLAIHLLGLLALILLLNVLWLSDTLLLDFNGCEQRNVTMVIVDELSRIILMSMLITWTLSIIRTHKLVVMLLWSYLLVKLGRSV